MRRYLLTLLLGLSVSLGWAHDGGNDHYLYRTTLCLSPQSVQVSFSSVGQYDDAQVTSSMRERLYLYARNTFRASSVPLEERADCVNADGFLLLLLRAEAVERGAYAYALSVQVGRYTAADGFDFRTRLPVYRYESSLSLPYNEGETGEAVYDYLPELLERMMRDIAVAYWMDNVPQEVPKSRPPLFWMGLVILGLGLGTLAWRSLSQAKLLPRRRVRERV